MPEAPHSGPWRGSVSTMKKLINAVDNVVTDALRGMAAAHPHELDVDLDQHIVYRRRRKEKGKVAIISGGGSGHEPLFGDVSCAGVSKRHAVDVLLAHRGAARRDAVAFGDAAVDIEMLEHCGTGVAMGNGSREVKDAADLVTDDVEADGLAKAFRRLGLNG